MLRINMYITIETLWKQGKSKAEIARLTGHDWKTVSKVIKHLKQSENYPIKKAHPKKLDAYKEKIMEWLEHNFTVIKIHEFLTKEGISVSYSATKNYVVQLKGRHAICIRFHSLPGEEAQVDFGYAGLTLDNEGKKRKTWLFDMRLSYSRLDYFTKVYDQKVETFIDCHLQAFEFFKGIPSVVKIDNLKAAILVANFYEPIYQQLYKQFADYYGFQPLPCRVRQPQEKGKTESGIKYVKSNFLMGRTFRDGNDFDTQLRDWVIHTCNKRVHGTTRKIPQTVFEQEEESALKPLPQTPFYLPRLEQRIVYRDCHVYVDYNYYSVPFDYVGKTVDIAINPKLVKISYDCQSIAIHARCKGRGEFRTCEEHYPPYKNLFSTKQQKAYQEKMQKIGAEAQRFFLALVEQYPKDWYRTTQGILNLTKTFPATIVNLACHRALAYHVFQYRVIKNICENGSYHLPLEPSHLH